MKEEVSLAGLKAGWPAGMLAWSNDSPWEEERRLCLMDSHLSPAIPSSPLISSMAGLPREQTLAQRPKGSVGFGQLVKEGKESPGEYGHVLAVWAQGCALPRTSRGSDRSHLPDQPALPFLCGSDRGLQKIKAADTQCHRTIGKCLEVIHMAFNVLIV